MPGLTGGAMAVPAMLGVNLGLLAALGGAGLLLLVAVWWSLAGDGIAVPRERWPTVVRGLAGAGWILWIGGLLFQVAAHVGSVGVATWAGPGH